MIIFFLLLVILVFSSLRFCSYNNDYMSKKNTTTVNGVFVVFVLFRHYSQYIDLSGMYDVPFVAVDNHLNQLIVTAFLFNSGFGMMESIRKHYGDYVRKIPSKIWKLLLRFDIAVFIYLVINSIIGNTYSITRVVLSLIGWESIGNSNWYILIILLQYFIIYISYSVCLKLNRGGGRRVGIALHLLMTIGLVYLLMRANKPAYYYDTVVLLPIGALFSEYRDRIERVILKSNIIYLLTMVLVIGMYIIAYFRRWSGGVEWFTVWAVSFIFILQLVNMKTIFNNSLFSYLGEHVFSIYILQRIPMIMLSNLGYMQTHKYISFVLTVAITLTIAEAFERGTGSIIKHTERNFIRRCYN